MAGCATEFSDAELQAQFGANYHVRHHAVFADQRERLVLVKGSPASRLLRRPVRISEVCQNRAGGPLHRLSSGMQEVFGDFDGRTSLQRSPPRWVSTSHVETSARYLRALPD